MVSRITLIAALFFLWVIPGKMAAQHTPHLGCGTTSADQELIKERMLENRRNKEALMVQWEAAKSTRTVDDSTMWVPVVFHLCSRADGTGQHTDAWVLQQMCYFNQNYEDQNIQFFLRGINRFNSDQMYINDATSSDYIRSIHRVSGAINIFVGGPTVPTSSYGAYYAPNFDWIFTWNDIYSWGLSHEMGHLFTLAHTFNGWEGTDYTTESAGSGHAPEMGTNGKPVEKVARGTAAENCQYAADGFCDTPPDYSSGGGGCTGTITWNDPDNVSFTLDQSIRLNYMSYFFCTPKVFSDDQKEAIRLDNISRGHQFVPEPDPLMADGAPTIVWPGTGAVSHYGGVPIELRWNAATTASCYLVTIRRTLNGGTLDLGVIKETFICDQTSLWVTLNANQEFTWKVKALTRYDLCSAGNTSAESTFNTGTWALGNTMVANIESSRVFPNPAGKGDEVVVEVTVPYESEARLSIQNALGQVLMTKQSLNLVAGTNLQHIDISSMAAGMYIVTIETENQRISHKLVVQE